MLCLCLVGIFHVFLGPLYQIVFDDRSAPTTITDTAFKLARQAYLAQPTDQQLSGTQVEPPPRQKQQSSRNRRNQEPTASSSTDSANITTSSVPPTTITSTVPIINSTTTTTTTPCAIQECAEKCAPNSSVCTECSESERCYLYCPLHFTHTSHSNQSAPRRNNISNTIIIVPNITNNNISNNSNSSSSNSSSSSSSSSSTTNNNNIAISKITPPERHTPINIPITVPANSNTSSSTSATIVFNARGGPARKRKRYNPDSEEFCNCGCNQNYLYSCMSQCKGTNCDNLVNRTCVSSTWLCINCKPATENTKA